MRRVGALGALIASFACASGAQAAPSTPLGNEGRWITDAEGRVVILHGVNMVSKRAPYTPAAAGFDGPDADFLADHGFNTVRVGLIYKAVEPSPGAYDEAYLDSIAATEALLAQRGIFSQLDFHQDLYGERFQGEGWPDWAVQDGGIPAVPQLGFPYNYFGMPALSVAFENFWLNSPGPGGVGLQDRYAAAFRRVAERFAAREATIGFDLMNEPWPGLQWPTCASPLGCPLFDAGHLAGFHDRVIDAIREVEPQKLVWYEPNVIFNFGADSHHPDTGDENAGFSFHVYCLPGALGIPALDSIACETLDDLVMDNADAQAQETGDALLLSEFGATDDLGVIRRNVEQAEAHMVSWQYWHYCACDDPTTSGPGVQALVIDANQAPAGANVKEAKLDVLARPYPQVVAGTPQSYDYVEADNRFELSYDPTGPGGQGFAAAAAPVPAGTPQTEVFIPARHYPGGYAAEVSGGAIASADDARVLRIAACPGASSVEVTITESGGSGGDCEVAAPAGAGSGSGAVAGATSRNALRLKLKPRWARAGKRRCLRPTVTEILTGARVAGVTVRSGRKRRTTDSAGRTRICRRFTKPGKRVVEATQLGYSPASARIRVRP